MSEASSSRQTADGQVMSALRFAESRNVSDKDIAVIYALEEIRDQLYRLNTTQVHPPNYSNDINYIKNYMADLQSYVGSIDNSLSQMKENSRITTRYYSRLLEQLDKDASNQSQKATKSGIIATVFSYIKTQLGRIKIVEPGHEIVAYDPKTESVNITREDNKNN